MMTAVQNVILMLIMTKTFEEEMRNWICNYFPGIIVKKDSEEAELQSKVNAGYRFLEVAGKEEIFYIISKIMCSEESMLGDTIMYQTCLNVNKKIFCRGVHYSCKAYLDQFLM